MRRSASSGGLSGGLHPGRHGAPVRPGRRACRRVRHLLPGHHAQPPFRDHEQRDARGGAAVRIHGRDTGTGADSGRPAGRAEPDVRRPPRRAWHRRYRGRHAAGGQHRHRGGHRHHHGAAGPAHHAETRLRPRRGHRRHQRFRHAGTDHSAVDRAGAAGRRALLGLPGGPARPGSLRAPNRFGRRPVHGRAAAGIDAGGSVRRLDADHCGGSPGLGSRASRSGRRRPTGAGRGRRATDRRRMVRLQNSPAGGATGPPSGSADATAGADRGRTGLHHPGTGNPHRSRRRRSCGRNAAGRAAPQAEPGAYPRGCARHRAGQQHGVPDPDRRVGILAGVSRLRRRRDRARVFDVAAWRRVRGGGAGHVGDVPARLRAGLH